MKCADLSLQALLSSRAAQRSGVPSLPDASDSVSADAAKHMVQAVQQFVAVLQIQTVRLVTLTPFDASNYGRLHACPIPPSSQPHKCVVLTISAMKTLKKGHRSVMSSFYITRARAGDSYLKCDSAWYAGADGGGWNSSHPNVAAH